MNAENAIHVLGFFLMIFFDMGIYEFTLVLCQESFTSSLFKQSLSN